jgi:hypothetical protein
MTHSNSINNTCQSNTTVSASSSGGAVTLTTSNTSNTASSHANSIVTVGGGSASDPGRTFIVSGVNTWIMGLDNSVTSQDPDSFSLSKGSVIGTTEAWKFNSARSSVYNYQPLTPTFGANSSTGQDNVTGAGTTHTVVFSFENWDFNNDYATQTFTAPVTGTYFFTSAVACRQMDASSDLYDLKFVTSNRTYDGAVVDGGLYETGAQTVLAWKSFIIADMDAADICRVSIRVSGMAGNTVDILTGTARFEGILLA